MHKNETHTFEKSILKPYDIRGVVDKNLSSTDAYFIGKSYGTLLQKEKHKHSCIVGYDGRHSSKEYSENVIKGLLECGIDVICIGLAPTPMVYFGLQYLKLEAGIIITASHNPPEYNGFKMLSNEEPIWGEDIQKLGTIATSGEFYNSTEEGKLSYRDIKKSYVNFILKQLDDNKFKISCDCPVSKYINKLVKVVKNIFDKTEKKELNIVWDGGNGAMAHVMKDIILQLPGKHTMICDTVDGDFPNHHPDPSIEEYTQMLKDEVKKQKADFGIAFDGDGDRIGIVDSEGYFFFGDQLLDVLMRQYLKENPGEKVLFELTSSQVLINNIEKFGGIPVMWKPGHSTMKAKMKSDNIKMAGETTGHVFYGENYNYDDAFYASMKLMNFLSTNTETLTEIRKSFPKTYLTKKIHIKATDEMKYRIPQEIAERMKAKGYKVIEIEGARVVSKDGWWLIRSSNTEPIMTARCEGMSEDGLEICKRELKEELALSGIEIEI